MCIFDTGEELENKNYLNENIMKNIGTLALILIVGSTILGYMLNFWVGLIVFLVGGYFLYQVSEKYNH